MCRLYAFLAKEPMRLECALIRAQNSLLAQSKMDERQLDNPDGWGIAYYAGMNPCVERRASSAFTDLGFLSAARRIRARIAVAHVRRGTVGGTSIRNVHPFRAGRWVLAHNGGIPRFGEVAAKLTREVDSDLMLLRRGETDSELIFLWILARIREQIADVPAAGAPLDEIVRAVRSAIERIVTLSGTESEAAALNLVLSDGESLVASRFHRGLYVLERQPTFVCELCGECHCNDCADQRTSRGAIHGPRAIVVASEPITSEEWDEVPEDTILGVTPGADLQFHPLVEPTHWQE